MAFAGRDLAGQPILSLFLEGVAERLHLGQLREPMLAAWGMAASSTKVLPGLYTASKEDTASTREGLRDLKARGMSEPGAGCPRWGAGSDLGGGGGVSPGSAPALPGP